MANVITVQKLLDGQNKIVIKVDGVVDTSDISVTGTIGASGFTTTTGLKTISFVAGALTPTLGQFVTFGDGTTTFPAGTYITGITSATAITVNNAATATNAAAAITITGTTGNVVLLDPVELGAYDNEGRKATKLRIDKIQYSVEDLLSVNLYWAATTDVLIAHLVGQNELCAHKYGGIQNNAGSGVNGRIELVTQGWSASAVLSFTMLIECTKQF